MTPAIDVFYYTGPYTGALLPETDALLARLGPERRERLAKKIEGQRALELAALRVLELAMASRGHSTFRLADVQHPQANGVTEKPYWSKGKIEFSISHSRSMVIVATAVQGRVGVDVEGRRSIDPRIVRRLIREDASIAAGLDEQNSLSHWTQIEAVLKGAGIGIMHGREIEWRSDSIYLRDRPWYVHSIECGPDHVAHVATDQPAAKVNVVSIELL